MLHRAYFGTHNLFYASTSTSVWLVQVLRCAGRGIIIRLPAFSISAVSITTDDSDDYNLIVLFEEHDGGGGPHRRRVFPLEANSCRRAADHLYISSNGVGPKTVYCTLLRTHIEVLPRRFCLAPCRWMQIAIASRVTATTWLGLQEG